MYILKSMSLLNNKETPGWARVSAWSGWTWACSAVIGSCYASLRPSPLYDTVKCMYMWKCWVPAPHRGWNYSARCSINHQTRLRINRMHMKHLSVQFSQTGPGQSIGRDSDQTGQAGGPLRAWWCVCVWAQYTPHPNDERRHRKDVLHVAKMFGSSECLIPKRSS